MIPKVLREKREKAAFYMGPYEPLQVEPMVGNLESLKGHMYIDAETGKMDLRLKDKAKLQIAQDPMRRLIWYTDWFTTNVHTILKSMLPEVALKCCYYALSAQIWTTQPK